MTEGSLQLAEDIGRGERILSKQLRAVLLQIRDQRLRRAYQAGKNNILPEFVFPSPDGSILDPDNLYHRFFLPVLAKAGIRKIRLHDLRHISGSLLIQAGASLTYVKEQMGHTCIQVTVDIYGHLIPAKDTPARKIVRSATSSAMSARMPTSQLNSYHVR